MNKYLVLLFVLIGCGEQNYQNNYYIEEVSGFSEEETVVINELLGEIRDHNSEIFSGLKPLSIKKNSQSKFGDVDYREFFCEIKINPALTNIFFEELALKYLVLHQIGKCFRLPLSPDQNDIMYHKFNSFLVPKIPEKIPEFSKKLSN